MRPNYFRNLIKPIEESDSVFQLLQYQAKHFPDKVGYPCISILRVLFGSVESPIEIRNTQIPPGFNSTSFESMRWRYHALPNNKTQHGHGKVILDVSVIPESYLLSDDIVFSIHRPYINICRSHEELQFESFMRYPISAAHYLGSWERYSARNDKRR